MNLVGESYGEAGFSKATLSLIHTKARDISESLHLGVFFITFLPVRSV